MSTLAAARADNFYFSKNYDPKKVIPKKSDTPQEKPFKVVEGQRVGGNKIRYETPFHVRCQGCQNMIAKGVRFNAVKTWVDNFHSTKIYEFRMKCPQCPSKIVVRTDPENTEYIYVSGARRIFQTSDCKDQSRIRDQDIHKKISQDPFFKLQNEFKDKMEYGDFEQTLTKIQDNQQRGLEDFQLNRFLRKKTKVLREKEQQYNNQKNERNLQIPLLAISQEDEKKAQKVKFKTKQIKKEDIKISQRQKIKEKLKNMHPNFKKILKKQIKSMNKPTSSLFLKK